VDRARAEELRGRIETGRNNLNGAEQHFTAAVAAAREPADAWMDLGSFYARQGQWEKMEAAIRSGIAADPRHDAALVDGARVLVRAGRDLPLAGRMLHMYLDSGEKTASEPAYRVHALLGRALAQQGDATGAQREFAAATSMASGFHAAGQGNAGR
jgi:Flp pilus assembly protein TadD